MHTMTDVEGDPMVAGHDWIQAAPGAPRYIRLGGYSGAVTAELVFTRLGWIGTSWIMQPPRTAIPIDAPDLSGAVRAIELAEATGQGAAAWAPLIVFGDEGMDLHVFSEPGYPRRLGRMHGGVSCMYIETFGAGGASMWAVVVNGILLTTPAGGPLLYNELFDAVYDQEREDV